MFRHPATGRRRLWFEDCEQRLLLTSACTADATEPVLSEELVAEIAPSEAEAVATSDRMRTFEGAANVSQRRVVDLAEGLLLVEMTIQLVVPREEVYDLGIDQAGDPTADEGPT